MSSNGHANGAPVDPHGNGLAMGPPVTLVATNPDQIKHLFRELELPFEASSIEWRVTNTNHDRTRGQVIPYADQRAYTDRLNALFTPAGWTRKYTIHTSANFERSKDQKMVAKVLITCELTIFGLGSHSATGRNGPTMIMPEQVRKHRHSREPRAVSVSARYLYYFDGVWVDLDERKRPRSIPQLPKWATPEGWAEGLRPNSPSKLDGTSPGAKAQAGACETRALANEIEAMAELLGRGLYRGLLRELARVWNPREIGDISLLQKVLEHMRSAERGLRRMEAALDKTGPEALLPILKALGLTSLERVDNLVTLKRIVVELERAAETRF